MHIDWWTLALQTVNVLILIWILSRFLFRPVADMIAARQTAARKLLDEAQANKDEAATERDKAAAEVKRIADTRADALKAAASDAEAQTASMLAAARAEADKLRAAASAEIERARHAEAAANAEHATQLAVDIAGKLLARLPDKARIDGFVDGLVDALAALPEHARAGLGAHGSTLHIKAARALTEAERETCRSRLAEALGRPVELEVENDPGLIAGLEVDTPHALIRNSFRADLDRIAAELTNGRHHER